MTKKRMPMTPFRLSIEIRSGRQLDPGWYAGSVGGTFRAWIYVGVPQEISGELFQFEKWFVFPDLAGASTLTLAAQQTPPQDPTRGPGDEVLGQIWELTAKKTYQAPQRRKR